MKNPEPQRALTGADQLIAEIETTRLEPAPNAQLEALALAVCANLPVLLWGEPGIGKSAVVAQLAAAYALPLETVIASIHEPSDFAGLPIVGVDPASGVPMAPPDWAVRIARQRSGLVFFDELSAAPPAVQAALLRVVLERRVGSLALPPQVRLIAAANPPSSAADGWHLTPPLANRFIHLRWTHDPATVARGLTGTWPHVDLPVVDPQRTASAIARARGAVAGFLSARPALTHQMPGEGEARGRAWPSPRTWQMALRLLAMSWACHHVSDEARATLLLGTLGDGPGMELVEFLSSMDLPDPERLLANPEAFVMPDRGDRQLAVLTAVVAAVQARLDEARWRAGWVVLGKAVEAGVPDVAARAALDLAKLRAPAWEVPATVMAFAEVLRLSGVNLVGRPGA